MFIKPHHKLKCPAKLFLPYEKQFNEILFGTNFTVVIANN
jgi:hypothetical protein